LDLFHPVITRPSSVLPSWALLHSVITGPSTVLLSSAPAPAAFTYYRAQLDQSHYTEVCST
jgi:hypothetical protein